MTDKELLELAAKAAGINGEYFEASDSDRKGIQWRTDEGGWLGTWIIWNPLTDDGDALRLAVKLKIDIRQLWERNCVEAARTRKPATPWCSEKKAGDHHAATRRAIVRAAAEIGKAMA